MSDHYHRWAASILAFVIFLVFLFDILEFLAWKIDRILSHLRS